MSKHATRKPAKVKRPKTKLGLPDLDYSKAAVLDSLRSPQSKRGYRHAMDGFIEWYCSEPRLSFNKIVVTRYRIFLADRQLAPGTIIGRLAAVRRRAYEAGEPVFTFRRGHSPGGNRAKSYGRLRGLDFERLPGGVMERGSSSGSRWGRKTVRESFTGSTLMLIMKMRPVCLLALAFLGLVFPSGAQTGTVTFYSIDLSAKKQVKTALAPVGTVAFTGWLFDGDKRLAHATRGRFMSFRLPAGPHDFTVPYKSKGPGRKPCQPMDCLHLDVEIGRHYCVRLSAKDVNPIVVPIMFLDSKIEQVSCQEASQEVGEYQRIDLKRVEPALRPALDASPDFPRKN